ncbi:MULTISPECIES: hypothetical protein [unclassified Nocardia]|uniref:hypothetical protein n=1 Tax=unclassified Nocardia TaxID=2637762 RepID=UPI0033A4D366
MARSAVRVPDPITGIAPVTDSDHLGSLALFQAEVAPEPRRRFPLNPLAAGREFSGVTP